MSENEQIASQKAPKEKKKKPDMYGRFPFELIRGKQKTTTLAPVSSEDISEKQSLDPEAIMKKEKEIEEYFEKRLNEAVERKKGTAANSKPEKNKHLEEFKAFRNATEEYKNFNHESGAERKYWQARWKYYGALAGLEINVPQCDRTMEEKRELESKGRKLIYVPPELSTIEGLTLLGKMHPKMGSYNIVGKNIMNEKNISGWIDVEEEHYAPNRATTEDQLRKRFEKDEVIGMNLTVYIIASEDSYNKTQTRFDSRLHTWVRLPDSLMDGKSIGAQFSSEGFLSIETIDKDISDPLVGGRSMHKKPETKPLINP